MVIGDGEGLIGSDDVYTRDPEREDEHDDEDLMAAY
jgi:hypothetical protein